MDSASGDDQDSSAARTNGVRRLYSAHDNIEVSDRPVQENKKLLVPALLLSVSCASVPEINQVPGVVLGGRHESYLLSLLSIASAKKTVYITNPYFLPAERMANALLKAVARGVRVIVLTPGKIDWMLVYRASRRGFGPLLLGGIEIYEYQPALLHAKTMVVDGVWAMVGTTNLDNRSFALNAEIILSRTTPSLPASWKPPSMKI